MDALTITAAALSELDDAGLDGLSMRAVAARLGVRVGGLYYHLPDKSALLRSMANEICREARTAFDARPVPRRWDDASLALCGAVRDALRRHRDAARVLAAAPLNGSLEALELMERLIGLVEGGVRAELANDAADTLLSYVTGFVLQEQIQTAGTTPAVPLEQLRTDFPKVSRAQDTDDDTTFRRAVTAILTGFAAASP